MRAVDRAGQGLRSCRSEAGFSLLWCTIALAALSAALLYLASLDPALAVPQSGVLLPVGIALAGLVVAAKRDAYEFARHAAFGCWVASAACLSTALAAGGGAELELAAVASGVVAALLSWTAWRASHGPDALPNPLLDEVERRAVREIDGVQFALVKPQIELSSGELGTVEILVQNAFAGRRRFALKLRPRADLGRSGHLVFGGCAAESEVEFDLPPCATARIRVPLAATAKARGSYAVFVEPRVSIVETLGLNDQRIRPWRARRYQRAAMPLEQVLGLMLGGLVPSGGVQLAVRVHRVPVPHGADVRPSPAQVDWLAVPEVALVRGMALGY